MIRIPSILLASFATLTLSGCLAKTAVDVVTAPVRVVSKGVDLATTSQSEADENRGRDLRRREKQLRKDYDQNSRRCRKGNKNACETAQRDYDQLQLIDRATRR